MEKNIQDEIIQVLQSQEVKYILKDTIAEATKKQMDDFSKVAFIERQKSVKNNTFKNTEKLLYGLYALEQHLKDEQEYLEMAYKKSSGSIVRYQKNKSEKPSEDQLLADRQSSYERSLADYNRIKKALETISSHKGYQIIVLRYLTPSDFPMSFEEIADYLAGTNGFSEKLNEKTVRTYRNKLINEIAVLLFGSDAI